MILKRGYLESRGIPQPKTIGDDDMTVFILMSENICTGEKVIEGVYTSEYKVLELMDSLPPNSFDWEYTYEEWELE